MLVAFLTGARSEWRIVEPMLRAAQADSRIDPHLIVTGSHLSARHGETLAQIRRASWSPSAMVPILEEADTPLSTARATGRAVGGLADALAHLAPDWVVVTGDRYESFAGAVAATMLGIPLAHVAGGETDVATNQDCNLRNATTKLAQIHLVSHAEAGARLVALGEEEWRIRIVGLPSLDGIGDKAAPREALADAGLVPRGREFLLVSYLPVTLRPRESLQQLDELLGGLRPFDHLHKLFVLSNADAGANAHDARIHRWAAGRADVSAVPALSPELYAAALRDCSVYVGNSSSGVIETPVFGTPAVIVGSRQDGRPRSENVVDVEAPTAERIAAAIDFQVAQGRYSGLDSLYGDGQAAGRICAALYEYCGHRDLLTKRLAIAELVQ